MANNQEQEQEQKGVDAREGVEQGQKPEKSLEESLDVVRQEAVAEIKSGEGKAAMEALEGHQMEENANLVQEKNQAETRVSRITVEKIRGLVEAFKGKDNTELADMKPEQALSILKANFHDLAADAKRMRQNPEAEPAKKESLGRRILGKIGEMAIITDQYGTLEAGGKLGLMPGVSKERAAGAAAQKKEQQKLALKVLSLFDKRAKLIREVADPLLDHGIDVDKRMAAGEKINQWQEFKNMLKIATPEDDSHDQAFVEKAGSWLQEAGKNTKNKKLAVGLEWAGKNISAHSKEVSEQYRKWLSKIDRQPKESIDVAGAEQQDQEAA